MFVFFLASGMVNHVSAAGNTVAITVQIRKPVEEKPALSTKITDDAKNPLALLSVKSAIEIKRPPEKPDPEKTNNQKQYAKETQIKKLVPILSDLRVAYGSDSDQLSKTNVQWFNYRI